MQADLREVRKIHQRNSTRLPGYDYSLAGAYFVTLVTYHRLPIFGEMEDGHMKLNEVGEIAKEEWFSSALHRFYIHLAADEFVIMPNHIHGIINREQSVTSATGAATLHPYKEHNERSNVSPGSLGAIIRAYKSAVTYRANSIHNPFGSHVWQRNYYDHIIRDDMAYEKIRDYIKTNPENWSSDQPYQLNRINSINPPKRDPHHDT